jgi:hypothetical protein
MLMTKTLIAKNSTDNMSVNVDFDVENQPIKVSSDDDLIEYQIVSVVERHRLITIRNPKDRALFSIFYGNPI